MLHRAHSILLLNFAKPEAMPVDSCPLVLCRHEPSMLLINGATLRRFCSNFSLQDDFAAALKDYVGRESPLYHAERLSEHYRQYASLTFLLAPLL